MAHADLFISNEAQTRVFEPIAAWLAERSAGPRPRILACAAAKAR